MNYISFAFLAAAALAFPNPNPSPSPASNAVPRGATVIGIFGAQRLVNGNLDKKNERRVEMQHEQESLHTEIEENQITVDEAGSSLARFKEITPIHIE